MTHMYICVKIGLSTSHQESQKRLAQFLSLSTLHQCSQSKPPALLDEARRDETRTDFSTAMAYSSSPADTTTTTLAADVTAIPTSNPIATTISLASSAADISPARQTASASQSQPPSLAMRPQFIQQQHQHHHRQRPLQHATNQQHNFTGVPQNPIQTQTTVLYPLASSGRGLVPSTRPQLPEQRVTVANPGVYPLSARSIEAACHPPPPQPQHQLARLFASSDSSQPPHSSYPFRNPCLHPSHGHMSSVSFPTAGAGIRGASVSSYAQPKVASFPCLGPGSNGHEESMDKVTDDLFVSVRDRKVRISDGASIYALCRSWLRNGYSEESQLQYGDFMKSLPKPSPMPMSESSPLKRKQNADETEIKEVGSSSYCYYQILHPPPPSIDLTLVLWMISTYIFALPV
ncbi:hypothetical protein Cgig2_032828 [Carnegiea gigantea]|uniref:Uncharacterized protein n=1 Tax=Carnegiea gigantea TaxID=171969 RepID=A0A9Q1GHY6_9CARY|nr:hypothetical protein Cgig2_032828 [Carnegiea gigantea]